MANTLTDHISELCMNDKHSDVTLVVGRGTDCIPVPAHRVILAARNEYFRGLLYGGLIEATQQEIYLDITMEQVEILLRYIYSDKLVIPKEHQMDCKFIFDMLITSNKYMFIGLENILETYLCTQLGYKEEEDDAKPKPKKPLPDYDGIEHILNGAVVFCFEILKSACLNYLDQKAVKFINDEAFLNLSLESMEEILKRDTFNVHEFKLYQSVRKWCEHHPKVDIKHVLIHIRFDLMSCQEIEKILKPKGKLDPNELEFYNERSKKRLCSYRYTPNENFAKHDLNACFITGEGTESICIADEDLSSYKLDDKDEHEVIVLDLNDTRVINHIAFYLGIERQYFYAIETSIDLKNWQRVVNYDKYICADYQELFFTKHPARYVRFVNCSSEGHIEIRDIEVMCKTIVPDFIDGITIPTKNVMNLLSAVNNFLVYCCQPYYIDSIGINYEDANLEDINFILQTSTDNEKYVTLRQFHRSVSGNWVYFCFEPMIVSYIRIKCPMNSYILGYYCPIPAHLKPRYK